MARAAAEQEGVRAWLQLDHATDLDIFKECVDCGYDSAMIDASQCEILENIRVTREAVQYAHRANVAVEAELGYIPKLGQSSSDDAGFTQPHQAKTFVEQTGVDLLAVAIGTAHGFYKQTPRLDFAAPDGNSFRIERSLGATWWVGARRGCLGGSDLPRHYQD